MSKKIISKEFYGFSDVCPVCDITNTVYVGKQLPEKRKEILTSEVAGLL